MYSSTDRIAGTLRLCAVGYQLRCGEAGIRQGRTVTGNGLAGAPYEDRRNV